MLEKLGIKNLLVCENQGRQYKLKMVKKKQGEDGAKKMKD